MLNNTFFASFISKLLVDRIIIPITAEQLTVSVENIQLKQASMVMQQSVSKLDADKNELIVKATVNVVCLHSEQFSPSPIPKPIYEVLKACM